LREAENKRRAGERLKKTEKGKAGLEKLNNDSRQIVEEKINPVELSQDLQPLPPRIVMVSREMLVELARKRAQAVYEYFVNQLSVKTNRVAISTQAGESGTDVIITVYPYDLAQEMQNGRK
jgi:hypothetical protein